MIGDRESNIILEKPSKFLGEGKSELWTPIGDYFGVQAELREHMGEKELGNSGHVDIFGAGAINYPLHKAMVYHDHD